MTTKTTNVTVAQFNNAMAAALKKTDGKMLTPDELYTDRTFDAGVWPLKYAGNRVAVRTTDGNSMLFYIGVILGSDDPRVYVDVGDRTPAEEEAEIINHLIAAGDAHVAEHAPS